MTEFNDEKAPARPSIAIFAGPGATILNTPPLISSSRARTGDTLEGLDPLRPQRLARPVTVYVEQFSAHPMERDAQDLYASPDGYIASDHSFSTDPRNSDDVPVYRVTLSPDDGLYPLPYVATQRDGQPWDDDCAHSMAEIDDCRQPYFPDASRLVEEIDRLGLDAKGRANQLSSLAEFEFFRSAPSSSYRSNRPDLASAVEESDQDYFPYRPYHLRRDPGPESLAEITNNVQDAIDSAKYQGVVWLEASPSIEETTYWFSLLLDTTKPVVSVCSPDWAHGVTGNSGDRNLIDAVRYCCSEAWLGPSNNDIVGPVIIQGGLIIAGREAAKVDSRPGGIVATGQYGGVVGSTGHGSSPVIVTYVPRHRFTHESAVNLTELPREVPGLMFIGDDLRRPERCSVRVSDHRRLITESIPCVEIIKTGRYAYDDPNILESFLRRGARSSNLIGIVIEGLMPYGRVTAGVENAIPAALMSGIPIVKTGRGHGGGSVDKSTVRHGIAGGNLSSTKARMLLIACLLRFGALPPAVDPHNPTNAETEAVGRRLEEYQSVFDSH